MDNAKLLAIADDISTLISKRSSLRRDLSYLASLADRYHDGIIQSDKLSNTALKLLIKSDSPITIITDEIDSINVDIIKLFDEAKKDS